MAPAGLSERSAINMSPPAAVERGHTAYFAVAAQNEPAPPHDDEVPCGSVASNVPVASYVSTTGRTWSAFPVDVGESVGLRKIATAPVVPPGPKWPDTTPAPYVYCGNAGKLATHGENSVRLPEP